MIEANLPAPSVGGKGFHLRRLASFVISYIEVNALNYASGRHPQAVTLQTFFTACATALNNLVSVATTGTFAPTAKSYPLATGANQAGPVLTSLSRLPPVYSSATTAKCTVNSDTGAITPVATGTSVITATWPADGDFLGGTATYVATVT